ncbi:MAG: penicillin-binding protein 2 [Patescibacteria group bacterium]
MVNSQSARRLNLISSFFVLVGLLLATRLFLIQIVFGGEYRATAEEQNENLFNQTFNRGSIFWQAKDGTLAAAATLESHYDLVIDPGLITNPDVVLAGLKTVFPDLDETKFFAQSARADDRYEEVRKDLTEAEAKAVKQLNLIGVQILEEHQRSYPSGNLGSHILGFMGFKGDEFAGRYGLESEYELVLRRAQPLAFTSFLSEIFSGGTGALAEESETGDLVTTIEPTVQRFLEAELEAIKTKWQSKSVGGIVLEPATGKVIAMAARPDFNPGGKQADLANLTNPLVEKVYEMGSIMKPITMASGLDAGVVTEKTTYNDAGSLTLDGKVVSNFDGRARGVVPMQEVLNQSLNTGAVFVMQALGRERFRDYLEAFGIGSVTGVDLPNEEAGLVGNLTSGHDLEFANMSFGQGIAMTPLNITVALSVLANGGYLVRPQLVQSIKYESGETKVLPVEKGRQVIKPESSKRITDMLVRVVDEALDGGRAKLPHYRIAAKTGTAQVPLETGRGYDPDRFLHSFFGYFPASAPRFTVFLYNLEPVGAEYASKTLTEPFSHLAKFLLNYYQVPPDR